MSGYALSVKKCQALQEILTQLSREVEAEGMILTDYGGNILVQVLPNDNEASQTLAALAAGSFAATRELAGLVGEKEFHWIFHHGRKMSIYIQCVAAHYLILALLGKRTTQGLVKLYVEKVSEQLERILLGTKEQTVAEAGPAQVFEINDRAEVFKMPR